MEKINIIVGVCSFLAGMIVMDALWAWRTGVLRSVWYRITGK
jgi:hypothetical protein